MAEQFLEKIYSDAMIIDRLRECVRLLAAYDNREAIKAFNTAMADLQNLLQEYAKADANSANKLQADALSVTRNWDDIASTVGIITGKLIPKLYGYMSNFTDIEVEDQGHLIKSSDSGFLTIKSADTRRFLHDIHDPMEEAGRIADKIYDAAMEKLIIFGCGLGYLPYKIWERSGGAISIVVYEEKPEIIEYATHYGVLSWIAENSIEIVHDPDGMRLMGKFLDDVEFDDPKRCIYISSEKKWKYRGSFEGKFDYIAAILQYDWELGDTLKINIWKNVALPSLPFVKIKETLTDDEWIVVAAGPSFDENLEFMRDSKGFRKLIAVNTVLRRMAKEGITPELSVAADSYEQLTEHLEGIEDFTGNIPLVADWVTNWKYTYGYKGPKCFVSTPTGYREEERYHEVSDLWDVSGTIACMAIEAAVRLGAKKVYLVGLDLAFPGGKDYAGGMPHGKLSQDGTKMTVKSVDGGFVETAPTFNSFRVIIEQKIAEHSNMEFINMSKHGALIEGAKPFKTWG